MKNADGRDRRTPRSQEWDDLRCDATTQELKIRRERKRLFSQHRWKDVEKHYLVSLPVIISRIKYGREKLILRLWRRLRVQYSDINFDTNPVEQKYRGMKAAGGAAAWYFIPVMGGPVLPIRQLMALEDMEIGLHPNSWNEAGKKHQKKLKPSRPHREKTAPSATQVVRMQLYTLQGGLKLETDTDTLARSSKFMANFMLHSSRAALPTATARKYGASLVTASALLCSDSFAGSLRGAMKGASKRKDTWVRFTVLKRRTKRHKQTSYYNAMVAIALTVCRDLEDTCEGLSVFNLYALHWTSRRVCSTGVHLRNTSVIERELWQRDFLVRPEGSKVLKLPPAAQVSILEARISFRLTMAHSNLSADLVPPLMYALRVVQQVERKLGVVLDTTKHWINRGDRIRQ